MPKDTDLDLTNVVKVDFKGRQPSLGDVALTPATLTLNEKKWELFRNWLSHGAVSVLFDARKKEVKVPQEFACRGDLRLNFCYDFLIPDFNSNYLGVWATLSFDSGEFFCLVPWESVYGLQSAKLNQGAVWFESFPKDQDQIAVLGFSEDMCESLPVGDIQEIEPTPTNNVVELDFSKKDGP